MRIKCHCVIFFSSLRLIACRVNRKHIKKQYLQTVTRARGYYNRRGMSDRNETGCPHTAATVRTRGEEERTIGDDEN